MDFGFTPENEAFRQEVRQFLADHVTPELRAELEEESEGGRGRSPGSSCASWAKPAGPA